MHLGFFGWWLTIAAALSFGVFHLTLLTSLVILRHLKWISEDTYRSIALSIPVKVAEGALAAWFAYKSLDWLKV